MSPLDQMFGPSFQPVILKLTLLPVSRLGHHTMISQPRGKYQESGLCCVHRSLAWEAPSYSICRSFLTNLLSCTHLQPHLQMSWVWLQFFLEFPPFATYYFAYHVYRPLAMYKECSDSYCYDALDDGYVFSTFLIWIRLRGCARTESGYSSFHLWNR